MKIYATDVDEEGLAQARQASYGERAVQSLSPELLERYFEKMGNRYVFRKESSVRAAMVKLGERVADRA